MLIGGILLGLVLGLVLGGRLENLADIRLRFLPLLFLAVIVRFGTEAAIGAGIGAADTFRLPLFVAGYGLLLFVLWQNRRFPGMALAFVGILGNALAITANGGRMPIWEASYRQAGFTPGELSSVFHVLLPAGTGTEFFLRLGPLGDVIPIPFEPIRNVASIGDMFLTAGLGFFLFATLMRPPREARTAAEPAERRHDFLLPGTVPVPYPPRRALDRAGVAVPARTGTGLAAGLSEAAALERPLMLGAHGMGMASPATLPLPGGVAVPRRRPILLRLRRHPYVRLALNGSFSALWAGQVISLFGDRVNQIALAAFVFEVTDSAFALALTFLVGTIPNLLFSPIAGTFVDRWDQKQVLIVSDILRAALALLIPVAVLLNVWLAYPLVFLITTVSIFFRPARQAILPRIVREEDLLSANSAMWVGETMADVINYPIAGLFVVFLASSLPIAFWFDAVTYLASAALLTAIVAPPLARRRRTAEETSGEEPAAEQPAAEAKPTVLEDLKAGWEFLRHETVLLANTVQGTAGQFAIGIVTVASLVLAQELTPGGDTYRGTYAFMETAIGIGNLVGGFALGLITARIRKGLLVIASYTVFGILVVGLGTIDNVPLVLAILFGVGVANMGFVIPSQTLFQERTPPELMGRAVSFRFALVFGGMSIAMGVGGLAVGAFGPGPVIAIAGVMSIAAGLAGLGVRAVREA